MGKVSKLLSLRQLFGRNMKVIRTAQGLKQEALAERAGMSRDGISDIENGRVAFSIDSMEKVGHALEVDVRELLNPDLLQGGKGKGQK